MKQLVDQREHNGKMLEAERAFREQQAAAERDWRAADREAREVEADRVEKRYRETNRATERRFWLGVLLAVLGTVSGQMILGYLKGDSKQPIIINTGSPAVTAPSQ